MLDADFDTTDLSAAVGLLGGSVPLSASVLSVTWS